jgi:type II secretory pathway component GspD/PulD (secretin)
MIANRKTNYRKHIFASVVTLMLFVSAAWAQTEPSTPPQKPSSNWGPTSVETFHLNYATQQSEANEVLTALRNILDPRIKITLLTTPNIIVLEAPPEQIAIARKLIGELDRPRKAYRLTYTVTDMDGTRRVGSQHFTMIATPGQRTQLKQVSKVPVVTGDYKRETNDRQEQVTYLDVGLMFDATVSEFGSGVNLRSKVEQSSVADEKSGIGPQDPIVRVSSIEGSSFLSLGKPLVLGSLDIPGSTRHLDIDVAVETIP